MEFPVRVAYQGQRRRRIAFLFSWICVLVTFLLAPAFSSAEEPWGTITPTEWGSEQTITFPGPGGAARYSVPVAAGESVSLRSGEASLEGVYRLDWLSPEGEIVKTWWPEGGSERFFEPVRFEEEGNATLLLTPESGAEGSVTFTAYDATDRQAYIAPSAEGASETFTIGVPGQRYLIHFEGSKGEHLTLSPSEAGFEGELHIETPTGGLLESSGGDLSTAHGPMTLPADGGYTIVLTATEAQTGSVSLDATSEFWGTITPTEWGTEQTVTFPGPAEAARYSVPVAAGESVSLRSGEASLEGVYRLDWLSPEGEIVKTWWPEGGSERFFEPVRFEEEGHAKLVITPEAEASGSVTFTAYDATDRHGSIVPSAGGASETFVIGAPGQRYLIGFEGSKGEHLTLTPSEAGFEGELHVETPAGGTLPGSGGDLSSVHGPMTLPADGDYTIVLTASEAQSGSVSLDATSDLWGTITPTEWGTEQTITFPGPAGAARYSVPVAAGESVSLRSGEASLEGTYRLDWLSPDGEIVKTWWPEGGSERFFEPVRFEEEGNATLLLTPESGAEGSVTFTAYDATDRHGSISPSAAGTSKTFTVGVPGQRYLIDFEGLEGEHLTLTPSEAGFEGGFHVLTPAGETLPASTGDLSTAHGLTLPVGGKYTVVLEGTEGQVGSVRLKAKSQAPLLYSYPEITGKTETGALAEASAGEWTGDMPMTFTYQWLRCASGFSCAPIEGATEESYEPGEPDVGKRLKVTVKAANVSGTESATSGPSAVVTQVPPSFNPVEPPVLSPKEVSVGESVEVETPGLKGGPPIHLSYEWKRCWSSCLTIPGASGRVYKTVTSDAGKILRVHVTATNLAGSDVDWSNPSGIVQSTSTSGLPIVSTPPMVGGVPRVSETLGATKGEWAGKAPITTSLQWQLCSVKATSCEDISGKVGQTLMLASGYKNHTLRVKVTANNEVGETVGYSAATRFVHPSENTAYSFSSGLSLGALETALNESGIPPVALTLKGKSKTYALVVPPGTTNVVGQVSKITGMEGASALSVLTAEVSDWWSIKDLGSSGEYVTSIEHGPSLHETQAPTESEPVEETSHEEYVHGAVSKAEMAGIEEPPSDLGMIKGPLPVIPGVDRVLWSTFDWERTPEETLADSSSLAMEFDIKQEDADNLDDSIEVFGASFQVSCLPWEENNFWLGTREPDLIETTAPVYAKLYWDTGAEDKCTQKDLTYGFYRPEYLEKERYETLVYFDGGDSDGDVDSSPITWQIQILGRHCDSSPWCVGIPYIDQPTVVIPILPNPSQSWTNSPSLRSFPGCYRYFNERYKTRFEEKIWLSESPIMGASECVYAS